MAYRAFEFGLCSSSIAAYISLCLQVGFSRRGSDPTMEEDEEQHIHGGELAGMGRGGNRVVECVWLTLNMRSEKLS